MGYRSCYGNELLGGIKYAKSVTEIMQSRKISRDFAADDAEKKLSSFLNVKHAHLLTTATAAMKSCLMALNPTPGDHVIVPRITFISTANVVLLSGLIPKILDVDDECHLSPKALRKYLKNNKRPIAVIAVHLDGLCADIEEIKSITDAYGISLIEDTAQAFGVKFENQFAGTFGRFGCFSFNQNKILSSGEGGAIVCNDDNDYANVVKYSNNGSINSCLLKFNNESFFGENYQITELCASMISHQIDDFCYIKNKLMENYSIITKLLQEKGLYFEKRKNKEGIFISVRINNPQSIKRILDSEVPRIEWRDSDLLKNPILAQKLSPYANGFPWNLDAHCNYSTYRNDISRISMLVPLKDDTLTQLIDMILKI